MVIFREVQCMRRVWWVLLIVLGITAMMWWGFVQQIMIGSQKAEELALAIQSQLN